MPEDGGEAKDTARGRDWTSKVVIPVIVAALAALAVAVVTPVGDRLREAFFPTKASVSGSVQLRGQPVAGARLVLDGRDVAAADMSGAFLLDSVGAGHHRLQIQALGAHERVMEFAVQRGATELNVGAVQLEPLVEVGFFASMGLPQGSTPIVSYDFTLWVHAGPDVLARITSVSYTLPAPLPARQVRGRPAQAFCYRQAGELLFEQLLTSGSFDLVTATIDLGDGSPFQVQARPGGQQRPRCPITRAETVSATQPPPAVGPTPPLPTPPPPPPSPPPPPPPSESIPTEGDAAAGRDLFAERGCGSCHTLADADSTGTIGPNLDDAQPSLPRIIEILTNGRGAMPSFRDQLSDQQILDIATYVHQATAG
jgi:mono/diheme cytochrome c family protein